MGDACMETPRLRPVDAVPVQTEEGTLVCLRDRERYAKTSVFLSAAAIPLVMLMDGRHTLRDIQESYVRSEGDFITTEQIREMVEMLDQQYFLESPRFQDLKEAVDREFRESVVRPAALAGASYTEDPEELAAFLDAFFEAPEGAGRPSSGGGRPLRAVLAPHIDYHRGGPTYSHAYRAVAEGAQGVDTFVILAVAHAGSDDLFALTKKDFETPLGIVRTDLGFVDELAEGLRAAGVEPFAGEGLHRTEHSAELQIVYLQHLFGRERHFHVVPILVGGFHHLLVSGKDPIEDRVIASFVSALGEALSRREGRVMVIGGVDLAHVGPQFGDQRVTEGDLALVAAADQRLLGHVTAGDAPGLYTHIREDMDARKICGFPAMMTMLLAMPSLRGEVLRYSQWPDPDGTVTFASVVFPRA